MIKFKPNKIFLDKETVAEQLRSTRQAKKLKLSDIAKKLNINFEYLQALEHGENNKLPKGVYGMNFLREYAIFLGLDYKQLSEQFKKDKNIVSLENNQEIFLKQRVQKHNFFILPKITKSVIIVLIVVICFAYLGFCIHNIISPPTLYIARPVDNLVTSNNFIDVIGVTEPEAQIIINGELIPLLREDKEGVFTKRINLKTGINTIIIVAKKKYGREKIIKRQILVNN